MKRIWTIMLMVSVLLLLGGCGANEKENNEAADVETLYKNKCLACHGADLQGASAPALTNLSDKYSKDEVYNIILNGVGMMPGKLLSEEETELMTEWLMEK
ncbi:c-type cytochrome [Neobacillus sp. LXY-4]|uniref:c-type cytochrome n=1 Tax=Neobacillus sp. LXY-4 TaxID=3379826 RepID=UPI003EDF18B7